MTLADRQIVVTRAVHQAAELADMLRERGANPLLYPCIAIAPPEDTSALDEALRAAADGRYDWLVVTSSNTVEALRQRVDALGLSLHGLRTAAVGPASAASARTVLGLDVQAMPDEYVAEALAETLNSASGTRIFLPQANIARTTLQDHLATAGAQVDVLTAYRTVLGHGGVDLAAYLNNSDVDALTFTSSSTVENCVTRLENEGGSIDTLRGLCAACIGPKTADTAREAGFRHLIVPGHYTLDGLVETLEAYFSGV